tara:strand:+ start:1517 stop:2287 length:771 start_codon:yes stop_codon:yes gene_type:complete
MRILITIPTIRGREALLNYAIQGLHTQLDPDRDGIVVHANGSAWEPPKWALPFVRRVYQRPKGTGPIHRFNLSEWECEYFLSLDDDLIPAPTYVQTTINRIDALEDLRPDRYALSWYARHWTAPKEGEDRYWVEGEANFRSRIRVSDPSNDWTLTTYAGCGAFACAGDLLPTLSDAEKPDQYAHHDDLWLNGVLGAANVHIVRPPGPSYLLQAQVVRGSLYGFARDNNFKGREANMRDAKARWGWHATPRTRLVFP